MTELAPRAVDAEASAEKVGARLRLVVSLGVGLESQFMSAVGESAFFSIRAMACIPVFASFSLVLELKVYGLSRFSRSPSYAKSFFSRFSIRTHILYITSEYQLYDVSQMKA